MWGDGEENEDGSKKKGVKATQMEEIKEEERKRDKKKKRFEL